MQTEGVCVESHVARNKANPRLQLSQHGANQPDGLAAAEQRVQACRPDRLGVDARLDVDSRTPSAAAITTGRARMAPSSVLSANARPSGSATA